MSSGELTNERLDSLVSKNIDVDDGCSPNISSELEDNLISSVQMIEKELTKPESDLSKVCQTARNTFYDNYEIQKRCE